MEVVYYIACAVLNQRRVLNASQHMRLTQRLSSAVDQSFAKNAWRFKCFNYNTLVIVLFKDKGIKNNVPTNFSVSSFVIHMLEFNASIDILTASIDPGDGELWSPESNLNFPGLA